MNPNPKSTSRYYLIDVIRGAAILSMVVYHLCYDIICVFLVDASFFRHPAVILWERSICFSFIIVSGISLHFSRRPLRRGVVVLLCGAAVSVVSILAVPSQAIRCGVLTMIGAAMLLTAVLRPVLNRLPSIAGMALSLLLFAVTYGVPKRFIGFFSLRLAGLPDALYFNRVFAFLGFPPDGFFSADYFPLIPWLFLFVFGWYLWRFITEKNFDGVFRADFKPLSAVGRHSLVIYLLHQPVLYAICALAFGHF